MSTTIRIAQLGDLDQILNLERDALSLSSLNDEDKIFAEWTALWRKESLEHYLASGWSFVTTNRDNKIVGYFLGQALLFFQGQTQSLWVEHLQCEDGALRQELLLTAIKLSREKHLQRVYLPKSSTTDLATLGTYKVENWNNDKVFIKTTRVTS